MQLWKLLAALAATVALVFVALPVRADVQNITLSGDCSGSGTYRIATSCPAIKSLYYAANSTGSANAQAVTITSPSGFSLTAGATVQFVANFANTGATTFNVNGTGAVAVEKNSFFGLTALSGGDLLSGNRYSVTYDGTEWVLLNPATVAASALTGTVAVANGGTGAATTSQNYVLAGPTSGSGAPAFRALVAGDVPSLSAIYALLSGATFTGTVGGSGWSVTAAGAGSVTSLIDTGLTASELVATNGSKQLASITTLPSGTGAATGSAGAGGTNVATQGYADNVGYCHGETAFTSSGTFTTPTCSSTSTVYFYQEIGAGGPGGSSASGSTYYGGGGCGGNTVWGSFTGVAASTGITITIGSGGAAVSAGAGTGSAGGSTSIGSPVSVTADGGNPGDGSGTAQVLCTKISSTGGTVRFQGGRGGVGTTSYGGNGGSSTLGQGGPGAYSSAVGGATGETYGGAGGGALNHTSGAGVSGLAVIWW